MRTLAFSPFRVGGAPPAAARRAVPLGAASPCGVPLRPQVAPRQRRARGGPVDAAAAEDAALGPSPSDFIMAEADYGDDQMTAGDIKAALLDSFYGTERGLAARSEVRAEINELITQLEAKNPNPSPTEMMSALNGEWKLVYTSNSELLAILALSKLPLVTVGDITQRVDTAASTVENKVQLSVPLSRTSLSATAGFEVRSPKRIAVRFERGAIATPQLLADIEVPDSVELLGQRVDLSPLRGLLQPLSAGVSGALGALGGVLARAPDLSFPLPGAGAGRAETWLLTTYLDDNTRITRGDGGSVFILVKEVPVTTPTEVVEPPSSSYAPASEVPPTTPAGYI